jgi:hypothetical protein
VDGWRLGRAAIGFVLKNRVLQRFLFAAVGTEILIAAGIGALAVVLRRDGGPIQYVLAGVGTYYAISLMSTAVAVGVAGMVADTLEERPISTSTGWDTIRRRRKTIAGWALIDLAVGIPSKYVGSWTIDQVGVLVLGFGWGLLSFFAIPTIALTTATTVGTARHSLRLMRDRWGDAVYGTVYLWVRAVAVFGLPAAGAAAAGVLLIHNSRVFIGGALFAAGVAGVAVTYLLALTGRTVITVVLYRYASTGTVYPEFPAELLDRSVRGPSSTFRRFANKVEGRRIRGIRERVIRLLEEPETGKPGGRSGVDQAGDAVAQEGGGKQQHDDREDLREARLEPLADRGEPPLRRFPSNQEQNQRERQREQ